MSQYQSYPQAAPTSAAPQKAIFFNPNPETWAAYCLLEKAVKQGPHVNVKGKRFYIKAASEKAVIEHLTRPESEGGKGVYKVLFFADYESSDEMKNFENSIFNFLQQFRADTPGNLEI